MCTKLGYQAHKRTNFSNDTHSFKETKYMGKESPTSGLGPDKLHHLFQICSEAGPPEEQKDSDQEKLELLQDFLAETLPVEVPRGNLTEQLTTLCQISGISSGESVNNLLSNPKTDTSLLRKIKDHFKKQSRASKSESEHEVANTVYYTAIASALVFHGTRLTSFSYKSLLESFDRLAQENWISKDIVQLFVKAQKLCANKL